MYCSHVTRLPTQSASAETLRGHNAARLPMQSARAETHEGPNAERRSWCVSWGDAAPQKAWAEAQAPRGG